MFTLFLNIFVGAIRKLGITSRCPTRCCACLSKNSAPSLPENFPVDRFDPKPDQVNRGFLPVFRFFFAEPLDGNVLLEPGPVAFSLFFHRFNMSVFLIKWKYIVNDRLRAVTRTISTAGSHMTRVEDPKNPKKAERTKTIYG